MFVKLRAPKIGKSFQIPYHFNSCLYISKQFSTSLKKVKGKVVVLLLILWIHIAQEFLWHINEVVRVQNDRVPKSCSSSHSHQDNKRGTHANDPNVSYMFAACNLGCSC